MTNGQPDSVLEMTPAEEEEFRREHAEPVEDTVGPSEPADLQGALETALAREVTATRALCDKLRLELLVSQVRNQLLAKSIPMTTGADLYAWATDRARNIIAGLQGETI